MPRIAVAGISGRVGDCLRRFHPTAVSLTGLVNRTATPTERLTAVVENFDITHESRVKEVVRRLAGDGVRTIVNAAGAINVDEIEGERYTPDPATLSGHKKNTQGAEFLAKACAEVSAEGHEMLLLHLSTESVFGDSDQRRKFKEDDERAIPRDAAGRIQYSDTATMPTMYGLTKALGEERVLENYREGAVVLRLHGAQGPQGCFYSRTVTELQKGEPFTRVEDMYVAHLVDVTVADAIFAIEDAMHNPERRTRGTYHLSASSAITPYAITLRFADLLRKPGRLVTPILLKELMESSRKSGRPMARRPHYTVLGVSKFERDFYRLPTSEEEVDKYIALYGDLFQIAPAK